MRSLGRTLLFFYFVALGALWLAAFPKHAFAQASDDDKRHGDEAMVSLRYQEALEHYKRAYDSSKNPAILYNMGRAYEGLGDFPKALDSLEEFNEKAPPELKAKVPKLDELMRDVRSRVATLVIGSNVEGAEIRLGQKVMGSTRAGQLTLRVVSGPQKLVVAKEAFFPFEKELRLEGGRVEAVEANLVARSTSAIVRITSPVSGAVASVDGKTVGVVPAETSVPAGQHGLALVRDGYESVQTTFIVAAGEKKDLPIDMNKSQPLLAKWWFWTIVGAAVAGGVVLGIALTTEKDADVGTIPPGQVRAASLFTF